MHPVAAASADRSLAHRLSHAAALFAGCAAGTFHVTPGRRSQVRYRAAALALASIPIPSRSRSISGLGRLPSALRCGYLHAALSYPCHMQFLRMALVGSSWP